MTEGVSHDIFIACTQEDKHFANRLEYFLVDAGMRVWHHTAIHDAADLNPTIGDGFAHAATGILVLSRSLMSRAGKERVVAALKSVVAGTQLIPVWHDIAYPEAEELLALIPDIPTSNAEQQSLDYIIEDILKKCADERPNAHTADKITVSTINNTELVILPLKPYNDWAVAISRYPVTNRQYDNFLKNVKSEVLDEILHHHVSEKINVSHLKENFHRPMGKLVEDGREQETFTPHDDVRFNRPDMPVVCISLIEALGYISWLNSELNFTGHIFTLIDPQLWRFAAFGSYEHTNSVNDITQATLIHKSSGPQAISKSDERSNMLGISDMFGNVWEWCEPSVTEEREDEVPNTPKKTVTEIAGGGYPYDLEHVSPFLSSEMLEEGISTRRSDLGFRIAALVNISGFDPRSKEQLASASERAAPYVEQYFNRNYLYY